MQVMVRTRTTGCCSTNTDAHIKYNTFDKEQKEGIKAFNNNSLHYNEKDNYLVCTMGQRMAEIIAYKNHYREQPLATPFLA